MIYAKERQTGKIVAAVKASPYRDYRCPTCNAEVFLRAGQVYVSHFAHVPGQGKPECDEFHPSEDLRYQWQTSPYEPPHAALDGLLLSLELEPEADLRRSARKWGL